MEKRGFDESVECASWLDEGRVYRRRDFSVALASCVLTLSPITIGIERRWYVTCIVLHATNTAVYSWIDIAERICYFQLLL